VLVTLITLSKVIIASEEKESTISDLSPTFFSLKDNYATIQELDYFNFLRISIIEQPEYAYSISDVTEKGMLVKFQKRNRYPELSGRIINDRVISRDVDDFTSLRKRQDDSFDVAVEISQPIYSGGSISNRIKMARVDHNISHAARDNSFSNLIIDSNRIYLQAIRSNFLYNYSSKMLQELEPYLEKVRERVAIGISDPIELAVFSIKFNSLSSKVQKLRTEKNRDIGIFEYFFKVKFSNQKFPEVFVPKISFNDRESYEVETAKLNYINSEIQINLTKSEFRPQFGFSARYTEYDINDNDKKDSDIRGGLYFSTPIFTFGRASAKISGAKAKANATKMSIGVEKKNDEAKENEIVNIIASSQNTRAELLSSYQDTKFQRKIISDRLDVINFSADSLVNSYTEELSLLENILETEINLLHGYFLYLHQNKMLMSHIGVKP